MKPQKFKSINVNLFYKLLTVALDVGYGVVKAMTADKAMTPFPSVYGLAHEIKFRAEEIATKYPGDTLYDDDGNCWVGNLALSQIPAGELLSLRGRTADDEATGNEFRVRMARVAIGKLLTGYNNGDIFQIRLATGLPVDHMRDAPALKAALIGQYPIHTDQTNIIADIVEVMVLPQPYGALYSQMLTPAGEVNVSYTHHTTGVVDIGMYTIDLAVDRDGEYIDSMSGSAESGVFTARERIAAILERDLREKPSYSDVEEVLRSDRLKIRGKWENYDQAVSEALEPLRRSTLNLMNARWRGAARIDNIFLAGGGATLVQDEVQVQYPHARLLENAQVAITQGYLNYALLTERNDG